jgi:predicted porin
MKLSLIAVAIAALTSSAFAQTATPVAAPTNTIYGTLDVNFSIANTGAGSHQQFGSGGYSSSALGFKGDRDLGDGLKAVYNIEAGILVDTGVTGNTSTGAAGINNDQGSSGGQLGTGSQLFSRQAYAGLSSDSAGTFTIGRQYAGSYIAVAGYGNSLGAGLYGGGATLLGLNGMPTRMNNALVYLSPKVNGFQANLSYTVGAENNIDIPTASGAATATSGSGAGYDMAFYYNVPKLNAVVSTWNVATASYAAGETDLAQKSGWQLAANYDFGVAKLYASASGAKIAGGNYEKVTKTLSESLGYSLSAMVPVGANRFYVSYSALDDKSLNDRDASLIGLAWARNLDAKTIVYVGYGNMQNNSRASYNLTDGGGLVGKAVVGYSPVALMAGLNLSF